jgi:hypothetical protein
MVFRKRKTGKRPYKKRAVARKPRLARSTAVAVKRIVKSQMNKVIETKVNDYYMTPVGNLTSIYHNTWYRLEDDPFYLFQGTADSEVIGPTNRIGDSVYAKSVHIQLCLSSSPSFSTVQYRMVILKLKPGASMPTDITNHPQSPNRLMNPIDREQEALMSVLYDRKGYLYNNSQTAGGGNDGARKLLSVTIPINKKLKYDGNNASNNSFRIVPYILIYGRNGDTGFICNFEYFRRSYFQDA